MFPFHVGLGVNVSLEQISFLINQSSLGAGVGRLGHHPFCVQRCNWSSLLCQLRAHWEDKKNSSCIIHQHFHSQLIVCSEKLGKVCSASFAPRPLLTYARWLWVGILIKIPLHLSMRGWYCSGSFFSPSLQEKHTKAPHRPRQGALKILAPVDKLDEWFNHLHFFFCSWKGTSRWKRIFF